MDGQQFSWHDKNQQRYINFAHCHARVGVAIEDIGKTVASHGSVAGIVRNVDEARRLSAGKEKPPRLVG